MSWAPLVGHELALAQVRSALARGRLAHAFLFVGPDGVGKRRTARHIAQGILCGARVLGQVDPCGQCPDCLQVEAGTHPDFFETGKPADRHELPIAAIQELCEKLALKPARGRYRIAIVDDADLLTDEAANSFLKTLEEPPARSLLILLATSVETQLTTIVSRCQVLRFAELTDTQVARVLDQTGLAPVGADIEQLARWSSGSVARAMALADPAWNEMRTTLRAGLARLPRGATDLASSVQHFIDEAGKEAPAKRARSKELIRLATDFYRDCLNNAVAPDRAGSDNEVRSAAERLGAQALVDSIERCLHADFHIGRFLHQALAVDCWIDDLAQIADGRFVAPIGSPR